MLRNTLVNLAAVLAVSFLLVGIAGAATPESGTITDDQPKAEFSGGPYFFPNATNVIQEAGEDTVCIEGTETCDVYRFEIALTKFNEEDDLIAITVEWPDDVPEPSGSPASLPDYDLELFNDVTGEKITQQATGANPEIMLLPVKSGKYQLRIIPYAGTMTAPFTGRVEYVKFEEDKSGVLGFAGALNPLVLAGFGLALLLGRRRRQA